MKEENLQTKLIESLVEKKFNYWKEKFIKELKEEVKSGLIADERYTGIRLRINYLIDKLAGENLK